MQGVFKCQTLLKLSGNGNECKPLVPGPDGGVCGQGGAVQVDPRVSQLTARLLSALETKP